MPTFEGYRKAGFPVIWVNTVEPHRAERELAEIARQITDTPAHRWDVVGGFRPLDAPDGQPCSPVKAVQQAAGLENTTTFLWNMHRFLQSIEVIQVIHNALPSLKARGSCLVVLAPDADKLPPELARFVVTWEFPLPTRGEIEGTLIQVAKDADLVTTAAVALVDAALGLTASEAEDAFALSVVERHALDPQVVAREKAGALLRQAKIEMSSFTERFEGLGGLDVVKEYTLAAARSPMSLGILLLGPPGTGKCLARDTPVIMFDGDVKPVQDIRIGDLLMGPDSTPRRVLATTTGQGLLWKVSQQRGDPYVVNGVHQLSLRMSGRLKHAVVNIALGDYLALKPNHEIRTKGKGWHAGVDWPEHPVKIPPYLLGLWLGDGSSRQPNMTTADGEVVEAMWEYALTAGMTVRLYGARGKANTYGMCAGSRGQGSENPFLDALREYRIYGNKRIPPDYLVNSRQMRLALLAGIVDSDGSLSGNGYDLIQKSASLAADIALLARSLGFAVHSVLAHKRATNGHSDGTLYTRLHITGNVHEIPIRLRHKRARPRQQKKNALYSGIIVEPAGFGDFFGFELDGDCLFLLGDFTVTHNSHFAKALGNELGIPTLSLDFGRLMGSLVGQSEGNVRAALQAVDAMGKVVLFLDEVEKGLAGVQSSGQLDSGVKAGVGAAFLKWMSDRRPGLVYVVATCNDISQLPPEYTRSGRFDATFWLDLPTSDERALIWAIYECKYGVCGQRPHDDGWTGAEIMSCCRTAAMLCCNLQQAGQYIIPMSKTMAEKIEALRDWAKGRAVPASRAAATVAGRRIQL